MKRAFSTSVINVLLALALVAAPAVSPLAQDAAKAAGNKSASAAPDTLGKLRASGAITVAFSADSLPFSFVSDKREPAGYSIELCKRVIAALGRAVGAPGLKISWITGSAAERVAMVASGKADLDCANTTATLTRMNDVDFSSLIFLETGGLLARGAAQIQKFSDLSGKNVGVIAGTTTETRLDALLKERLVNAKVVKLKDGNEGIAMLESGSLDAFAGDKVKLIGLALQAKDPKMLSMLNEDLSIEPLAFAVPRGDSSFRLEVNKALAQVYAGDEIEAIFKPWLGGLGRPSGVLATMYLLGVIPK